MKGSGSIWSPALLFVGGCRHLYDCDGSCLVGNGNSSRTDLSKTRQSSQAI